MSDFALSLSRKQRGEAGSLRSRDWIRAAVATGATLLDQAMILAAVFTAAALRFGDPVSGSTLHLFLGIAPAYALAAAAFHSYDLNVLQRRSASPTRALAALATACALGLAAAYAFRSSTMFSRLETGYLFAAAALYLVIGRLALAVFLTSIRTAMEPNILIIGDGDLEGLDQVPTLNVARLGWTGDFNNPHFLEKLFQAVRNTDRILLMFQSASDRTAWAALMRSMSLHAEVVEPELASAHPLGVGAWRGFPTLVVARGPLTLSERVSKRAFDLGVVAALIPVVLPVMTVLAGLIVLDSRGPVLFKQYRVGRNNRRYHCYKFRTMRIDLGDQSGCVSTQRSDRRITRIGTFLRRTSLDELPQLWNVLRGDMSLVGPRPHALGSTADGELFWHVVPDYWARHAMKPGLTGLAQVRGFRGATHSRHDIVARVAADVEYINTWSLSRDVVILLRTLTVLIHRNAF